MKVGTETRLSSPPIFPRATLQDLFDDLAETDRQLDQMGTLVIVDPAQYVAKRDRLNQWRERIIDQIATAAGEAG